MPLSARALRRHKRAVKLQRRYSILKNGLRYKPEELTPKCRHWHINCGCMGAKDREGDRTREERQWRKVEGV